MQIGVRNNLEAVLARMEGHKRGVVEKAVPRALNRCGEKAITAGSRQLRDAGYAFSAGEIRAAMSMIKASQGRLTVKVRTRRNTKSLIEFSPRESKAGVSVKIHGARKLIKGAFIAQRLNGKSGVYVEDKAAGKIVIRRQSQYKRGSKGGWHAYPCRKLYGPSVGGSYSTERIQAAMRVILADEFETRLTHEIKYLSR